MEGDGHDDLRLEGLAHDLNNVFETISEAGDLLASDPNWQVLAATIHRSVERGRRILGSYLETNAGCADLDVVLDRAIEFTHDFLRAARRTPIQFEREVESGIRLAGPAGCWERVLVNLFLNAAQAAPEGGRVEVKARKSGNAIDITVADNGPGIPEAILPMIFTPRFSTEASRSGLGLHIVDSIVRKAGGTIRAANRPGPSGAMFHISLPNVEQTSASA